MPETGNPSVSTTDFSSSGTLEERVLRILETANPKTIKELVDRISKEGPLPKKQIREITDILKRLDETGKIQLIDLSIDQRVKAATYAQGAGIRQGNNWPYLVLSLAVAALVAVYELPPTNPLVPIRWVLASLLAVFLPGYATVQLLFSGKVLENTERYAFSIGLGFALLGLIGLILNYTPWGIEATSVVTSLFVYTLLLALIALYRRC